MSSTFETARDAIATHWTLNGSILISEQRECYCSGTPATPGSCIDPGDGSGLYNTEFDCHNDVNTDCYIPGAYTPTDLGVFFRYGGVVDHWATYIETNGTCTSWWPGQTNTTTGAWVPGYCLQNTGLGPQNLIGSTNGGPRGWAGIRAGSCSGLGGADLD